MRNWGSFQVSPSQGAGRRQLLGGRHPCIHVLQSCPWVMLAFIPPPSEDAQIDTAGVLTMVPGKAPAESLSCEPHLCWEGYWKGLSPAPSSSSALLAMAQLSWETCPRQELLHGWDQSAKDRRA